MNIDLRDWRLWVILGVFFLTIGASGVRRSQYTTFFSASARLFIVIGTTAAVAGYLYRKR